jgi:hypothetical protein
LIEQTKVEQRRTRSGRSVNKEETPTRSSQEEAYQYTVQSGSKYKTVCPGNVQLGITFRLWHRRRSRASLLAESRYAGVNFTQGLVQPRGGEPTFKTCRRDLGPFQTRVAASVRGWSMSCAMIRCSCAPLCTQRGVIDKFLGLLRVCNQEMRYGICLFKAR